MNSFRDRKLVVATNQNFKIQSGFGVPMPTVDINYRHPQTSPAFPSRTTTRDEIRDCTGEYITKTEITSRLSRLTVTFDADARLIAGWLALAMGVATAPVGTQVAEVQTITPTGTVSGGTWQIGLTLEGSVGLSDPIAWNATSAQIQAAIDDIPNIKKGQVTVAGTLASTVTLTGAGKFVAGNLPLFTVVFSSLTGGGTLAIAQTTAGSNKLATVTRSTATQTPQISLIVGFEGDTTPPRKYRDLVVNSVTIAGALRAKVTVTVELIGNARTVAEVGYVIPVCVNIDPIFTKDCRINIDGEFAASTVRDFNYTYSNNIFAGDDPFPYNDIDVVRLEHGDRTSSFTFSLFGSPGDVMFDKADDEEIVPVILILGSPANRATIIAPATELRLSDTPVTFSGEANRSGFQITGTPFYNDAVAGTPDYVEYRGPETSTLLTPST